MCFFTIVQSLSADANKTQNIPKSILRFVYTLQYSAWLKYLYSLYPLISQYIRSQMCRLVSVDFAFVLYYNFNCACGLKFNRFAKSKPHDFKLFNFLMSYCFKRKKPFAFVGILKPYFDIVRLLRLTAYRCFSRQCFASAALMFNFA